MEHCPKCNGFGYLPQYKNIDNGICYECGGIKTRSESIKEYYEMKNEADKERREKDHKIWELKGYLNDCKEEIKKATKEKVINFWEMELKETQKEINKLTREA